jgi:hypothetical protein
MNIFKSFTLKWWQAGLFKWSLVSLGIIVGATWPDVFNPMRIPLLILVFVPGIYLTCVWWKQ